MAAIRTFVAVSLTPNVRRAVADVESRLLESQADVRWTPVENLHITLKFLGDMASEDVDTVASAVRSAMIGASIFRAELAGVGVFPKSGTPRVVWVGVTRGGLELGSLAGRIDCALAPLGFAREPRPFSPHITLGRVRSPRGVGRLGELIAAMRDTPVDAFDVTSIILMRSDLRPQGPIYSPLREFALS